MALRMQKCVCVSALSTSKLKTLLTNVMRGWV